MNRPQSKNNFNRKSTATIEKIHRKVRNTKQYATIDDLDVKSLINNGIRIRSKKIHILPQ